MNTPSCQLCRHAHYNAASEQTVCVHPSVAERSAVAMGRVIGLDAGVVRYRNSSAGRALCGPAGVWFTTKEAA